MGFLAADPVIIRKALIAVDNVSYLTNFSQAGCGPWDPKKDAQEQYDYVVVGGGSAGCVLATRLAEDPNVKVLILEAGYSDDVPSSKIPSVFPFKFDTDADWGFRTVPQEHANSRVMMQPRGKAIGGTSTLNAMMYHRGPASDYDEWGQLGNPGWSYKECLPYFKKSEGFNDPELSPNHPQGPSTQRLRKPKYETHDPKYHGTEGPWQVTFHHLYGVSEGFIEASIAEGVPFNKDFNGESTLGVNRVQTFIDRHAVRSSLSRAFLKQEGVVPGGGKRGTIRVVYGATISRVLVHTRKGVKVAYGAEFVDHSHVTRRVMAVREVLLCGGTFGSPHILLASGIGPAPQPLIPHIHTLPGVGANLADHLGLSLMFKARHRCATISGDFSATQFSKTLLQYAFRGSGAMSSQVAEAVNFVRLEDIAPEFVAREKANGTWQDRSSGPGSPHLEIIFAPAYSRKHSTILAPDMCNYFHMVALLMNPCSAGTVKVTATQTAARTKTSTRLGEGSNRIQVETIVDPNYFSDPFDIRVMGEAVKFMRKLGKRLHDHPDFGGIEVFPGEATVPTGDDRALETYAREYAETYYHPTSTCRMGPATDSLAVVDARLNVHGIERLRVVDASVMPKLPAAHTCAPTVMIAERCADMIREDWGDSEVAVAKL
ncbi:hypothetical protein BGZ59_007309 [Podila verticillata]|nr:hypothetical protein BGZ59_007309 [Podila verticillata]KFH71480.1 hypothetical protein MVEG_01779 [Podila verticillata NRRL 6337]